MKGWMEDREKEGWKRHRKREREAQGTKSRSKESREIFDKHTEKDSQK